MDVGPPQGNTQGAAFNIPPFAALARLMETDGRDGADRVVLPRKELLNFLRYFLLALPIDEDFYLKLNPGVKDAVAAGHFASASQHFAATGYFEGRAFTPYREVEHFDLARPYYRVGRDYYENARKGLWDLDSGDYAGAEACFREAVRVHPAGFHARLQLGSLLLRLGRLGEGELHLERAREIDANEAGPHRMLALVALILRQPDRRAAHLEHVARLSGRRDRGAASQFAQALATTGQIGRAEAMLRAIPKSDLGGQGSATLAWLTRQVAEARRLLKEEAARLRAGGDATATAAIGVAWHLARLGRRRLARRIVARARRRKDVAATVADNTALAQRLADTMRLCDGGGAALSFLSAQPGADSDLALVLARADLLHEQGRDAELLTLLEGRKEASRDGRALQAMALARLHLRQDQRVLDVCRVWQAVAPDNASWASAALFALAGLGALRGARVERERPGADERWPDSSPIPPAIVQFWDKPTPPDDVATCIATWRDRNPGFAHRLVDDESGRAFMAETYGADAVEAWDHCHHPAMRSDFFRCGWLAVHGGFYADCDNVCRAPLAVALGRVADKSLLLERTETGAVMNRFIACAPGHPVMTDMFAHVVAALVASARGGPRVDIWQGTGPGALMRAVGRRLLAAPAERDAFLAATGFLLEMDCDRFQGEKNLGYKQTAGGNWRLAQPRPKASPPPAGPAPLPVSAVSEADRAVAMAFESLGGGGHGCEFGIFQRAMGAEPLGLLRWADVGLHELCTALESRLAGIGEPEFTRLFTPKTRERPEWWTTDHRYHMAMRTFVMCEQMPEDEMRRQVTQRMRFLRAKLLADLAAGDKIFVYKDMRRNLTAAELSRLHAAVRSYGDNVLLYIRYADANHPAGHVTVAGRGLLVGAVDHFSHEAKTDAFLGHIHGPLLALCRAALALRSAALGA